MSDLPGPDSPAEAPDVELAATALDFLHSRYAGDWFSGWPIDRRLDAYLRRRGLAAIADNGTVFTALLDEVMPNVAMARRAAPSSRR